MRLHKVLVVDDDPLILDLVRYNLESAGFEVLVATDGVEGLQKAQQEMPDLITLDIMLPELNGYEVINRLRQNEKTMGIPILILSVRELKEDKEKGLNLGANGYLTKPFRPKDLVKHVMDILKNKDFHREEETS